jgi:hypothetical protein
MTPRSAWEARAKARPEGAGIDIDARLRVRRDRIGSNGKVTLRYGSRLHQIGVGRDHAGTRVIMLVDDLDVRILTEGGELLRRFTLDPTKRYQGTGLPPGPPKGRPLGWRRRQASTMSRDICPRCPET